MDMIDIDAEALEEIKQTTNPVERQMLMQKYGLIAPKLLENELQFWQATED